MSDLIDNEEIQNVEVVEDDVSTPSETNSSNTSFNLNDVEEAVALYDDPLDPGTYNFVVTEIKYETPERKEKATKDPAPYIAVHLETKAGKHEERFYMSEAARGHSLSRFKHFVCAVLENNAELIDKVISPEDGNKVLSGKKVRVRLRGEEQMGKNGVYMRVSMGFPPFAEAISIDPAISKLKRKKITLLPPGSAANPSTNVPSGTTSDTEMDDLPF